MEIVVHQAPYNNKPVHIAVSHIKGQIIPIDEEVHKSIIKTTSQVWYVIETKEEIQQLIKEAVLNE